MRKMIYKYGWLNPGHESFEIPEGAEILTFQMQNNQPHIWVLVDPERPKETRKFKLIGTGIPIQISDNIKVENYIGTVQEDNRFVWHLFEIK